MSGRILTIAFVLSTLVIGYFFYLTLQHSPEYKGLATDQMAVEYSTYTQTFQKVDRLQVGETPAAKFFALLNPPWKFIIHDKTLVATVPPLISEPLGQVPSPEVLEAAKTQIRQSLMTWLEDKYHTKKDLLVEVHIQDAELQAK